MNKEMAFKHLQTEGNYIKNDETGKIIECVNMVGGKYLSFDEHGNTAGFKDFDECMDWVGIV